MKVLEGYINVLEARQKLGVHSETIRRLCRQEDIPGAIKVGNTWLIEKNKLEIFARTYRSKRGWKKG